MTEDTGDKEQKVGVPEEVGRPHAFEYRGELYSWSGEDYHSRRTGLPAPGRVARKLDEIRKVGPERARRRRMVRSLLMAIIVLGAFVFTVYRGWTFLKHFVATNKARSIAASLQASHYDDLRQLPLDLPPNRWRRLTQEEHRRIVKPMLDESGIVIQCIVSIGRDEDGYFQVRVSTPGPDGVLGTEDDINGDI